MVFYLAILVGALFVWLAVHLGFYETWSLLFNIIVSIYLAVFLAPTIAACAPASETFSAYCIALSMVVLAGGCFAILYGLSYVFLTSQYSIPFPKVLDIFVAGAMGFLSGFLVLSFVALIITVTPLARNSLVRSMGLNPQSEKANIGCIAWCCDLVHSVASPDNTDGAAQAAIERLFETSEETESAPSPQANDRDEPLAPPASE